MDEYIKKSVAVDVIVKYPYEIAGKTATAIKMIEDLPSADVVPRSTIGEIFALIWDAFQSTYYDSEFEEKSKFEEKFDKIEKKYIGE